MTTLRLPTIPNSPLKSPLDQQQFGLMQLRINPALNFIENALFDPLLATYDDSYQNSQAHSPHFLNHMNQVLNLLKSEFPKTSRIVEVGCGKGSFVELVQADEYFEVTGFDATYEGANPLIHKRYLQSGEKLRAEIIVLRHVLEHIQAPHNFLSILKDIFGTGKIYIEVPNYDWIADNGAFFDITYEHVNYFSQHSLRALFNDSDSKFGLCFGDQYQYLIADISTLSDEFAKLYNSKEWKYLEFDDLFPNISEKILSIESHLKVGGKLYVWGAATKGCIFLVHCANRGKLLNRIGFAVDLNPQKSGRFLPGSLVPIRSKEEFFASAKTTDVLLVSNPNYVHEIMAELRQHGLGAMDVVTL